jgi:hypothetical protein
MIRSRHTNTIAKVIAVSALFSTASTMAVDNGCAQWDMSGKWSAVQSNYETGSRNRTTVRMDLQQTGSQLQGSAVYAYAERGGLLTGDDAHVVTGPAVGSIQGTFFELTIYWNDNKVGFYTGQIGSQGLIVGTTYDKNDPFRNSPFRAGIADVTWHSSRVATCPADASAPPASNKPTVALGRVPSTGAPGPAKTICEAAQSARARNSPAAPGLERQCAAQTVLRAVGDSFKQTAIARTPPPEVALPPLPDLEALAADGESIANQDLLATQLRDLQGQGQRLRGFDIGMAAADGDTAPGPGKQRIHDALGMLEQQGYETAVAFSLQRNANADLASIGARIAAADANVAQARAADPDPFFQLGFDIATGIFGDKSLGANGNTASGPGSNRIRDALGAAAKLGFDAGVAFHLGRNP